MRKTVRMSPEAAKAALRGMNVNAGPEAVRGFLSSNPSKELLTEAMGKFTNYERTVVDVPLVFRLSRQWHCRVAMYGRDNR